MAGFELNKNQIESEVKSAIKSVIESEGKSEVEANIKPEDLLTIWENEHYKNMYESSKALIKRLVGESRYEMIISPIKDKVKKEKLFNSIDKYLEENKEEDLDETINLFTEDLPPVDIPIACEITEKFAAIGTPSYTNNINRLVEITQNAKDFIKKDFDYNFDIHSGIGKNVYDIYSAIMPLILMGCSPEYDKGKVLPESIYTDGYKLQKIAMDIAMELREFTLYHQYLKELSDFYKEIKDFKRTEDESFDIQSVTIYGKKTNDKIQLKSPMAINAFKYELKRNLQFNSFPYVDYDDNHVDKLSKASDHYKKIAVRTIAEVLKKHGFFRELSKTSNTYNIKDEDGKDYKLTNYVTLIIYEIAKQLKIAEHPDANNCKLFEDTPTGDKNDLIKQLLKNNSNQTGDIDINTLLTITDRYYLKTFSNNYKNDMKNREKEDNRYLK